MDPVQIKRQLRSRKNEIEGESYARYQRLLRQIGAEVKSRREQLGLTERDLEIVSNVPEPLIRELETNALHNCKLSALVRLGVVLGFALELKINDPA